MRTAEMIDFRRLGVAAALGLSISVAASGPAASASLEEVCAAGAKEGSFVYWAQFEDDNWQKVADGFAKTYPDIEIKFLSLRDEEMTQRILTTASAGQPPEVDLISLDRASQAPLVERGLIDAEVDWTELGVSKNLVSAANSIRTYLVGLGLAYNTETTKPEDLPNSWEELIDAKYAKNVVVDPRGRPFGYFALVWGEEKTLDYVKRLSEVVQPVLISGGTAGMTAVLNGEAMMSTGGRADSALELQSKGAPMDIKYLDLVPTEADYNALVKGAKSPNAAKCFAGWNSSPEGSKVFESVEFKENLDSPRGAPADATAILVQKAEEADLSAKMFKSVNSILQP